MRSLAVFRSRGIRGKRFRTSLIALASLALTGGVLVNATGNASAASPGSGGTITVLADTTREPAIEAFEKANPSIKVTIETYSNTGNDGLEQKFALYDKAGAGWPDVLFSSGNDLAWADSKQFNYTENLSGKVSKKILAGFGNDLSVCKVGNAVYCMPNDLGQVVLWYNATLFKQWGYTPPQTWQDYEALSLQIAQDHPGYFTGLAGDVNVVDRYLWPSGCPISTLKGENTVEINLKAPSIAPVSRHVVNSIDSWRRFPDRLIRR